MAFWAHAQEHYRHADGTPSEELGNIKASLRPLRTLYGTTPAKVFGPLALRVVRDAMVKEGLARSSVNGRVNRIRRAFKWAASMELIPASVVVALGTVAGLQKGRTAARETEPVGPVALATVEATLPHLSRPVAGLVRLQLITGMRPREACMVRGCVLREVDGAWFYVPASHKTLHRGRGRTIPLGPRAVELLAEYRRDDPAAYLFDPRDAVHPTRGSITPAKRDRYTRHSYGNAIDRSFPHPTIRKLRRVALGPDEAAELLAWRKPTAGTPTSSATRRPR